MSPEITKCMPSPCPLLVRRQGRLQHRGLAPLRHLAHDLHLITQPRNIALESMMKVACYSESWTEFALPLFEIALVLVRLDHVVSRIVNPNHSVVRYQARTYMKIRRRRSRQ
jgi:hypothetical protein